ncbi:helix-turn-helix domain-containing protein [Paenibacillus sp. JSM ZJ436]|uniref:helix-turn-helix domain-containing protein n=1 Tax=Paenibacillus sp. JSM ZJ436 TaxID=3376190 RepID=UPI00378A73FF
MMKTPVQGSYQDPSGWLSIEYDRRVGYFSMATDHIHDHYELYYLIEGERIYFMKDRTYRIRAGDLVYVNRNVLHKTLDSGRGDHERVVFYLQPDLFARSLEPHLVRLLLEPFERDIPILRLPALGSDSARSLVERIVEEMEHTRPGRELLLRQWTAELLLHAWRNVAASTVTPADIEPMLHPTMQQIVRDLNERFAEPLQLTQVAEAHDISPSYLSRLFKQTTGFTFSDYINLLRIQEAQRLLRESQLPITDIAWQSGFSNFSHFGKMFKRTVKLSPREYRRQYQLPDFR